MTAVVFLILRILLCISLYAFLFSLFYILWKDIRQQGSWLSKRKFPSIGLSFITLDSQIRIRHFEGDEINIGRDPASECYLEDENVSSHHAKLKFHHAQWWLEDLGSTNGTFINKQPLKTPVVVISGDEIGCGKNTLTVSITGDIPHSTIKPETNNINLLNGNIHG
jgi:pSer/pThr/pTyr-binding forkhead associated (FHA) protein